MRQNIPVEIKEIEDFIKYKKAGVGYIWIEDSGRSAHYIHPAKCHHVKERDFRTKVRDYQNQYGRYFYHEGIEVLEKWAEANKRWSQPIKRCGFCQ